MPSMVDYQNKLLRIIMTVISIKSISLIKL